MAEKPLTKCLILLLLMKMQNKTTLKYHFTPIKLVKIVSLTIVSVRMCN